MAAAISAIAGHECRRNHIHPLIAIAMFVAMTSTMTSVRSFLALESAFTAVHFAIVSPLIALAWRQ